jgi:hypothetical protein
MSISSAYKTARQIYTAKYLLLNVLIAAIYYKIIGVIISVQQFGVAFYSVPIGFVYVLVASASVLMTISIYAILKSGLVANLRYSGAVSSAATTIAGGVFGACGCSSALLSSGLALLLGSGEAMLVSTLVAERLGIVFGAMSLVNIILIASTLNNLSGKSKRKG